MLIWLDQRGIRFEQRRVRVAERRDSPHCTSDCSLRMRIRRRWTRIRRRCAVDQKLGSRLSSTRQPVRSRDSWESAACGSVPSACSALWCADTVESCVRMRLSREHLLVRVKGATVRLGHIVVCCSEHRVVGGRRRVSADCSAFRREGSRFLIGESRLSSRRAVVFPGTTGSSL